jgi:uncharacterized protein YbdZ (MbtH family)
MSISGLIQQHAAARPEDSAPDGPPGTPLQEIVRDLFAEVLGLPRGAVHADSDFFRIGGHPAAADALLARARQALDADLGAQALREAPTPARFAALAGDKPAEVTGPGGAGTQSTVLPFRLHGRLDAGVLEAALADLGRRHEALRNSLLGAAGTRLRALPGGDHRLELALPSVAVDQFSQLPLAAELARAYAARATGTAVGDTGPMPGPAPRALWGDAAPTSLPPGGSPLTGDLVAGTLEVELDGEAHARLARLAAGQGATLFMVVHTALAALLTRLGAEGEVTLAAPVPARYDTATRAAVGPYGRVLALTVDTGGDPAFAELLRRVRAADLAAYRDPAAPLALPGGIALSVLQEPAAEFPAGLLTVCPEPPRLPLPSAELGLILTERQSASGTPAGLAVTAVFPQDTVGEAAAAALVGQLVCLLESAVQEPHRSLSRLRLVPGGAEDAAGVWSGTRPALPATTVAELFAARAAEQPRALALGDLTYAELDARSDLLAHALIEYQAGPGTSVLIAIASPAGFAVAALATAKTGAACVPVDPVLEDVPERLRPVVLLLDEGADRVLGAVAGAARLVRGADADLLPSGGRWPVQDADRTAPAGSGDPVVLALAEDGTVAIGPGAVAAAAVTAPAEGADALWLVPDYPDANDALGLLATLARGARVHVPGPGEPLLAGPREVVAMLRERRAGLVLGEAGEPLLALARAEGVTVTVGGGWAEGRIVVRHTPDGVLPAPGFGAYVLDARLRPVPAGGVGALYVGGAGVAQGYAGDPAATGERFLPDPFGGPQGATAVMWRTGRAATVDADGTLHVLDEPPADDPFADEYVTFVVVCDGRGHSALWPAAVPVPAGWRQTYAEDLYELCLDHLKDPR